LEFVAASVKISACWEGYSKDHVFIRTFLFNVAWTANFDSDAISMDVVQGANPATVGWTSEPSKTGNDEENTGWAKFDDIGSIGETTR
jgi:hypothetical protein